MAAQHPKADFYQAPNAARLRLLPAPAPALADAERRQLTVMFCDLAGEEQAPLAGPRDGDLQPDRRKLKVMVELGR
jgi:hypothetical protein